MCQHRIKEGIMALKDKGVKVTNQRLAIMEYIVKTESHPTAEEIYHAIRDQLPHISCSTVYNNLRCLKESGLIHELAYGKASSRYEWIMSPHYHVVCKICGAMRNFNYPQLKEIEDFAQKSTGFTINRHLFEIYGTCSACQKKST